jgi:hypothetical protein
MLRVVERTHDHYCVVCILCVKLVLPLSSRSSYLQTLIDFSFMTNDLYCLNILQ